MTEIIKSYLYAGKRPPLFYYRDKDKVEIDLIIEQNGTLYPLVCSGLVNMKNDE